MKLSIFLLLTGYVMVVFARATLKNQSTQQAITDTPLFKIENITIDRQEFSTHSESNGYVIAYETDEERVIKIIDSSENIVSSWKDGKWDIINCEKSIEVTLHCLREITDLLNERRVEKINNNPVKPASFISYADTLPKQSYIMFQETGTSIFHNGIEVALRRKNGTWKVIDSRKAMEVMYQNIYTRDSIRKSK